MRGEKTSKGWKRPESVSLSLSLSLFLCACVFSNQSDRGTGFVSVRLIFTSGLPSPPKKVKPISLFVQQNIYSSIHFYWLHIKKSSHVRYEKSYGLFIGFKTTSLVVRVLLLIYTNINKLKNNL